MDSEGFSHVGRGRQRHSFSCWHLRTISVNFAIDWKPGDLAWLCLMWMQLDWMKIYVLVHKKDGFYSTLGFVCFFTWTVFIGYLRQSHRTSCALRRTEIVRQSHLFYGQPLKWLSFYAFLFLSPVNGSTYSFMLIWSDAISSCSWFRTYSAIFFSFFPTVST